MKNDSQSISENNSDYYRLFDFMTPFSAGNVEDLNKLAEFMTSNTRLLKNSSIPAGYTYLGQFIDHDLSQSSESGAPPESRVDIAAIKNARVPFLNLDSLYGDDSAESKELFYSSNTRLKIRDTVVDSQSNLLGTGNVSEVFPNDLPRDPETLKPLIPDVRNDENLAIAQMHVAFIKFHNTVVETLGDDNSLELFEEARREVRRHYQSIVLEDYLPHIIDSDVLKDVRFNGNKYYFPDAQNPRLPIEFSVAAFRLGHSMVRFSYNWNRVFGGTRTAAILPDLLEFTGRGTMGGQNGLISAWAIDWTQFFDFDGNPSLNAKFNFSRKIDTTMTPYLGTIKKRNADGQLEKFSLAKLNLLRGMTHELPSGQDVARRLKKDFDEIEVLEPDKLAEILPESLRDKFSRETPLWYYLLAEAELSKGGERLGQVGSRIVAEAFIGLLRADKDSILNNLDWSPRFGADKDKFRMTDLLKFVRDNTKNSFDELNPLGPAGG